MNIDTNDPRLTAYVLDELDEADRAIIEAELSTSPTLRAEVDRFRVTAQMLKNELQAEPTTGLTELQRQAMKARWHEQSGPQPWARRYRIAVRVTAIAACLMLTVGLGTILLPTLKSAREASPQAREGPAAQRQSETAMKTESTSSQGHRSAVGVSGYQTAQAQPRAQSLGKGGARPQLDENDQQRLKSLAYIGGSVGPGSSTPTAAEEHVSADHALPERQVLVRARSATPARSVPAASVELRTGVLAPLPVRDAEQLPPGFNTESYDRISDNPFLQVAHNPLSTFSIDVDTAAYANVRRFLTQGQRPPKDAVRIEEMINYFPYDYPPPDGDAPFSANIEVAACPWDATHRLARIGLKGRVVESGQRPAGNFVFLIDVSGSMQAANKLPLLQQAMTLLVNQLGENDRVAIVTYAGNAGLALESTPASQKSAILLAISGLQAGGCTNGAGGIQLAYQVAAQHFIRGGVNRVILATDGDFNVGVTNVGDLTRLIEDKTKNGVFLSVLGFGMGNYKDATLEHLADKGNGNYAYIDTFNEARKVLVEQLTGTLVTIAKDVKIQVEFNPGRVTAHRLIGYENRLLRAEDFNDDRKDAGEVGAGHTVTAFYELVSVGQSVNSPGVDPLRYQQTPQPASASASNEILTLKLRYKQPDGDASRLLEFPVVDGGAAFAQASPDFKFAASVAGFGMLLRDSPYKGQWTFDAVLEVATEGVGRDPWGYRAEFIEMVRKAEGCVPSPTLSPS